ncbi:hypothetical protein ACIBEA_07085 [Streptomyces sp. NPDC051555]|uniref:hypothetical protein n=1 Tax=Streptomyces sp. NPDC051555 TaxID=3365657 RepID=UPI0037A00861
MAYVIDPGLHRVDARAPSTATPLGLAVHREFGTGPERGTVHFLGGGFLEV